jgi:hypothetical protein
MHMGINCWSSVLQLYTYLFVCCDAANLQCLHHVEVKPSDKTSSYWQWVWKAAYEFGFDRVEAVSLIKEITEYSPGKSPAVIGPNWLHLLG